MSGTSVDAIDAALVVVTSDRVDLRASLSWPIPGSLRTELLQLTEAAQFSPDRLGELDREVGICLASAALDLLRSNGIEPGGVRAIGSHGQTIRHRPARPGSVGRCFSWQIGDPNTIAAMTGICTVADFRRRDIAAGGQGAPLVPAFHAHAFRSDKHERAIVNIGGMANITILPAEASAPVTGFDTGPGNVLLDGWNHRHRGTDFDRDGVWGASGKPDPGLLATLLAHPFFSLPPPKSTGREEFNLPWLDANLGDSAHRPEDIQAALVELSARSIAQSLIASRPEVEQVYLCGGGAHNAGLVKRLQAILHPRLVAGTTALGIDPDWVEACTFAWLAQRRLAGLPGNLPAVTGASRAVCLGGIYPAS